MKSDPVHPLATSDTAELRPLGELDRVATLEPVETEAGRLAAGSSGTIVAVWNDGKAYDVEFVRPVEALVTLKPSQIRTIGLR